MILEIMGTTSFNPSFNRVASSCNLSENTPPPPATLGCNNNRTITGGVSTDARHKKGGFTLVELSIVLIIIGLIVGGVLGGQSLIKSAELQRVVNEFRQYETAVNAFRLEFSALPGDMDDAFDYWESSCGGGTKATCNGDGDGYIDSQKYGNEEYLVWNHLSLAGIVPGSYTGKPSVDGPGNRYAAGENCPKGSLTGTCIGYIVFGTERKLKAAVDAGITKLEDTVPVYQENILMLAGILDNKGKVPGAIYEPVFSPKEARAVDTKMDDGMPALGRVNANPFEGSECLNIKNTYSGDVFPNLYLKNELNEFTYDLSSSKKGCRVLLLTNL